MDRSNFIIIGILLLAFVVAVVSYSFLTPDEPVQFTDFVVPPVDEQAEVSTGRGEEVADGVRALTPVDDTELPFSIVYYEFNDSYTIALLREPIAESRQAAEAYLLRTSGLTKEQLCTRSVMVSVPYAINSFLSGQNFGLSFCPGSVVLE